MQRETTSFAPLGASALSSIDSDSLVSILDRLQQIRDCTHGVWSALGDFADHDPKSVAGVRLFIDMIGNGIDEVVDHMDVYLQAKKERAST